MAQAMAEGLEYTQEEKHTRAFILKNPVGKMKSAYAQNIVNFLAILRESAGALKSKERSEESSSISKPAHKAASFEEEEEVKRAEGLKLMSRIGEEEKEIVIYTLEHLQQENGKSAFHYFSCRDLTTIYGGYRNQIEEGRLPEIEAYWR